jgi:hypothetical protein
MNSPYCGWNKNFNEEPLDASDYDFLQINQDEEITKRSIEINSLNNATDYKNNESD